MTQAVSRINIPRLRFDVFMHWLYARYKLFLRLRLHTVPEIYSGVCLIVTHADYVGRREYTTFEFVCLFVPSTQLKNEWPQSIQTWYREWSWRTLEMVYCFWVQRSSTEVERWSLTGELSLSCAWLIVGQVTTLWVNCALYGSANKANSAFHRSGVDNTVGQSWLESLLCSGVSLDLLINPRKLRL